MAKYKNIIIKLCIVVGIFACAAVGLSMLSGRSSARYESDVDGTGSIEPGLFNTVLLGDLHFQKKTETAENGSGNSEVTAESSGKLSVSIPVSDSMLFGVVDTTGNANSDLSSEKRRLRPGSVVAIPFTVTNGTTLEGLGEDGETVVKANVAQTDIGYSINLITTVNIPLEYDVYKYSTEAQRTALLKLGESDTVTEKGEDGEEETVITQYNYSNYAADRKNNTTTDATAVESQPWGQLLNVSNGGPKKTITYIEEVGYCAEHKVYPESYTTNAGTNVPPFILEQATKTTVDGTAVVDDGIITVDRYMLVVYWPDIGSSIEETMRLTDSKYMKEIDIIEVRLEIESWVENDRTNSPDFDEATTSILRLQKSAVGNETYYILPAAPEGTAENTAAGEYPNASNVFGRGTIPFFASRAKDTEGKEYFLDFVVTNAAQEASYTWNETESAYNVTMERAALNGARVAIAVPYRDITTGKTMNNVTGAENDYSAFSFSIEYDGATYTGKSGDTPNYITTEVWEKNPDYQKSPSAAGENADTTSQYIARYENAYRIIEFTTQENLEGGSTEEVPLTLDNFTDTETLTEELRLIIRSTNQINFDNKDDFKILVYQSVEPTTVEPPVGK